MLPDLPPMPPGIDPPKTLVLNLSGTLIHSEFVVKNLLFFYYEFSLERVWKSKKDRV